MLSEMERKSLREKYSKLLEQKQQLAGQLAEKRSKLQELVKKQEQLTCHHQHLTQVHQQLTQQELQLETKSGLSLPGGKDEPAVLDSGSSSSTQDGRRRQLSQELSHEMSKLPPKEELVGYALPDSTLNVHEVSKGILDHIKSGMLNMDLLSVTLRINRYGPRGNISIEG